MFTSTFCAVALVCLNVWVYQTVYDCVCFCIDLIKLVLCWEVMVSNELHWKRGKVHTFCSMPTSRWMFRCVLARYVTPMWCVCFFMSLSVYLCVLERTCVCV